MKRKLYDVTIPIAGHITYQVRADSPTHAIEMFDDLPESQREVSYEALSTFVEGNVCHCPHPWEQDAVEVEGETKEEGQS